MKDKDAQVERGRDEGGDEVTPPARRGVVSQPETPPLHRRAEADDTPSPRVRAPSARASSEWGRADGGTRRPPPRQW